MKRINVTVSEVHTKMLKARAKEIGSSVSEVVRRSVEIYLGDLNPRKEEGGHYITRSSIREEQAT